MGCVVRRMQKLTEAGEHQPPVMATMRIRWANEVASIFSMTRARCASTVLMLMSGRRQSSCSSFR